MVASKNRLSPQIDKNVEDPFQCVFAAFAIRDDFVKSPDAALRFTLRRCSVRQSTPHSSGFARLACGLFTKPSYIQGFCDFLRERQELTVCISDFLRKPEHPQVPLKHK